MYSDESDRGSWISMRLHRNLLQVLLSTTNSQGSVWSNVTYFALSSYHYSISLLSIGKTQFVQYTASTSDNDVDPIVYISLPNQSFHTPELTGTGKQCGPKWCINIITYLIKKFPHKAWKVSARSRLDLLRASLEVRQCLPKLGSLERGHLENQIDNCPSGFGRMHEPRKIWSPPKLFG